MLKLYLPINRRRNPSYLNYDSSLMDDAQIQGYRVLGWGGIAGDPIGGLNRLFVREGNFNLIVFYVLELNIYICRDKTR